ncbi:MAG: nucleotidyltransferase domain-containing protein [Eubacteriales bacterium]
MLDSKIATTMDTIKSLHLPNRFEQKLLSSVDYIFSREIPQLESIILFGSCARNELRVTSDVDLLIITTEQLDRASRGEIASVLEEELDGVGTDAIFYTHEQYENSTRLFTTQVKKDGLVLYHI